MTLHGIQLIRAVAATMVVVFHAGRLLFFKTGTDVTPFTAAGAAGVDLFFVVSGFIMVYTTANRDFSISDFLRRRTVRVVPLYWLMTILMGVLALTIPDRFFTFRIEPPHFAAAFVFFPVYNGKLEIFPPLSQGWTLVYEMFFYLALAVASHYMFARRLLVLSAVFAALVVCGLVWRPDDAALIVYSDPILFEFLFGCLAAELITRQHARFGAGTAVALIVTGAAALVAGTALLGVTGTMFTDEAQLRVLYWGVPSFLIVLGMARAEAFFDFRRWRIGGVIGDSSYSLYLSHSLVLSGLGLMFRFDIARGWGGVALVPVNVAVCLLAGWLCWRYVERPMTLALSPARGRDTQGRKGVAA